MQDSTKHDSSAGFGKVNKEQESYTDLPAAALPLILPHLGGDLFFVAATSAVSRDWRIAATEELAQCRKLIVPECLAPAFSDEKLKQALKRMSPLGPSVLDLSECHRLTDMSMRQVILSLREVPEEISLRNCCTISWRGLKLLCRMLMALHRGELYQRQIANDERDDDSDGWKTPSLGDYDSDTPSERGGLFDSDTSSDGSGLEEVRRRRPWNRKRFQPMSVEVASDAKPSGEEANVLDDVSDLWHKVLAAEELPPGRRPLWFDQFIGWSSTQPQQPSIARDAAFAFSDDQPPTIMNLPDAAGLGSARWRLWRLKIAGVSFKECTLPKLQRYFMSMPLVWKLVENEIEMCAECEEAEATDSCENCGSRTSGGSPSIATGARSSCANWRATRSMLISSAATSFATSASRLMRTGPSCARTAAWVSVRYATTSPSWRSAAAALATRVIAALCAARVFPLNSASARTTERGSRTSMGARPNIFRCARSVSRISVLLNLERGSTKATRTATHMSFVQSAVF